MDQSRSIPTATSFRTLDRDHARRAAQAAQERGPAGLLHHLIAYAIAKVATEDMPVMAHHFEEIDGSYRHDDGAVNLGLAVDVEKKDGTRTLMVPVIRDAGRMSFAQFLDAYNALVDKARTNTSPPTTSPAATSPSLTPAGSAPSHRSASDGRSGHDRRHRLDRLSGRPGTVGPIIGAEKVMTMTSTYDHRIIQGAESGRFLQRSRRCFRARGLLRQRLRRPGVELPSSRRRRPRRRLPPPPRAPAGRAPSRGRCTTRS